MARQADTDERDSVDGVNPGTELGRYTVDTRIEAIPGGERWTARDTTLERDVTLVIMPADEPSTAAALDAARRAAGVEAAQLVRILDVGTEGDHSFIAEEPISEGATLTTLVGDEGLPAEEVRRITGEVATGVEAARARGLHHLTLTPETVLLTPDGRVKVRGLATHAALSGIETEGEEADREDATGVVALAYAGLTATWPLDADSSLPSAPRDGGGPPAPSRVAVGVPGDLDTICRETLVEGTGPDSPGDYAAQVAPWSRIPLAGAVRTTPGSKEAATDLADQGQEPHPSSASAEPDRSGRPGASASAGGGAVAGGAVAGGALAGGAAPGAGEAGDADRARAGGAPEQPAASASSASEDATREIPRRVEPPTTQTRSRPPRRESSARHTGKERDDATDPVEHPQSASRAAAAAAAAAGAVGTGAKVIGGRLGHASKTATGRSKEALHDARARREAIREDRSRRTSLGAAPVSAELEPPAPLLPAEAGAAPSRQQSNLVIVMMVAFVAIACVLGTIGASKIGEGSNLGKILGADETTAVETSRTSSSGTGGGGAGGGEPFAILNAAGFDPAPGDGVEHNAEVQRVYDGDPETAWTTEGYNDPDFGGVKEGVGVTVDLGQQQEISSVTLVLPTSARATVFAGDEATSSGTEIGQTEGQDGEVVLEASDPVRAQYVTVWFTSLVPGDDGRHRAALGEITLR